jgi:hypothetical protein
MNILVNILIAVAATIALLLLIVLFMRKNHYVKREILINASSQKVFDYIKLLKNQDEFNKHAMVDPDRIREFKGTDGTVGYTYAWKGDRSAGEGEKEIKNIIEGKSIETEIRFIKPMRVSATIIMETETLSDNQTRVSWTNAGTLKYPINAMIPMMERSVRKGMDSSLATLKNILEK